MPEIQKPKSVWDKVRVEQKRPFTWATPAPVRVYDPEASDMVDKAPAPWRVAHRDAALSWLKGMSHGVEDSDLYTDHESELDNGRLQIWVGLRNNRDPVDHLARLQGILHWLQEMKIPVKPVISGGRLSAFHLVDDLKKDVLRGKAASLRTATLRLAQENPELRSHLIPMITGAKKIDQKGYQFYVVVNQKIESGWEYKEDANDQKKEVENSKVLARKTLVSQGLDPADNSKWMTQSDKQGTGKSAKDWTPEQRLLTALGAVSQAVSHTSLLARETAHTSKNADKALKMLEAAEQILGRDVARDLSLPGYH